MLNRPGMLASAQAIETDLLSAAPRASVRRPTQSYGYSELGADEHVSDEHTEVVMRDGATKRIRGRYRDYLMIAVISANLAAFGAVLFSAFGPQ